MVKVERSVIIRAPLEEVFTYISDPRNELEWMPSITEVWDISGHGVGQRHKWIYRMFGILTEGETEVTDYIKNRRLVRKTVGDISCIWNWKIEGQAGGTKLTLIADYTTQESLRQSLDERAIRLQNEREADLAMTVIRETIEARTRETH
jgi:uncharacterized protein YndB with AHSA1/START domain